MAITFCIPSKNNLRYLKPCIKSIQDNSYYKDNEILVYIDQDNDGTCEWLEGEPVRFIKNFSTEPNGIGHAYDTMFQVAKHDLVVAFHADMILGIHADKNLLKHHKRGSIVCSTRIEPPLHPPGPEKIVKDFGIWPEDLKLQEFDQFVKQFSEENENKTTASSFAPWLIDRRDHLGHDPIFLSVYEDADLFRRFVLAGYAMIQSWDSLVYHLTCRGGQFLGAEKIEDFQKKDELWLKNNQISMMEYIRKWGGMFKEYGPCEPRPNKKYDLGLNAINCQQNVLSLEPYFSNLKVDINYNDYIMNAQTHSKFNLSSKFVKEINNDISIEYDGLKTNINDLYSLLVNIEDVLEDAESNTNYEVNQMILKINKKETVNIKTKLN
jgi:glycosyltransferase involved in cell wall biosynthesis